MPQAALKEILAASGFDPAAAAAHFHGADPVFPTRYRIGAAGAASLSALGLAISRLHEMKGGRKQVVAVDLRAAAASLRSARYLRIDGREPPPIWDPLSGFYPVRDGWVSIHCNFANHRDAAMGVLACGNERKAAEGKSAGWHGDALEEAIHAAGGCAGYVRTRDQWEAHRQAQAVALQPLLEIVRIGDAPPQPLPSGARPLSGVRVLDLTRVLAGPTCGKSLAEHGADVLKISAAHLPDSGAVELDTGIGKLSARLDLRNGHDLARLQGLAAEGDVFCQSYRPGALAGRGFAPEEVAALRPGIVYVTLSAWGTSGPWRERRGFDSIVQAVSGMAQASGEGSKPQLLPVSAIDYVSGYLMAFGAAVALARRAEEGGSWLVRVGLARVGKWIVDRGTVPDALFERMPPELAESELQPLLARTDSPQGTITHLKPVLRLSETPPYWRRPPVPLGTHPAQWPARELRP